VPRWEPSLEDYIDIAAFLLGANRAAVAALPRLGLAESALRAPFASFGGVEAYPTLIDRPPYSSSISRGTIRCQTPTSEPRSC
jgi:hypothetical protein